MKKCIYITFIIGVFLAIGTAGALDQNTISFKQGIIQYLISAALLTPCVICEGVRA